MASSSRPGRVGGSIPGPTIRVHVGVRVHLTNKSSMSHSIDFHASQTAMNDQMVEIKPGGSFIYTFAADYAGVWMYHCGTAPALHHIANVGMVIVEPKGGLPKVDQEVALVQSEWYLGAQGDPVDYAKANAAAPPPDYVVFNGVANQYKDNPIQVTTKGRVRVFVSNQDRTSTALTASSARSCPSRRASSWRRAMFRTGAIIEFSPQEAGCIRWSPTPSTLWVAAPCAWPAMATRRTDR